MAKKFARSEAEWQTMVSELQALRRKLHSKSEALLIISKDLDATQKERDQYKLMAEKLRVRCQAYKRQFSDFPLTKDQASLIQMLRDMKNQKMAHQKQSEVLQQKLNEALGDVKLLRERFARQRIGDEGVGPRHFPAHEREELVSQLEDVRQQVEHFRQEFNIANDQVSELMGEKEELAQKCTRLNCELNFMLNGDKKRIIDIDALCMENKYLQERVKQCEEEKNSLHAQMSKLKALLNSRKTASADIKPGKIRNSGLVISPKQVKEILMNRAGLPTSAETISDLQSIAAALLETINDKNLALHHLRNTNKILGKRVAELELKLKTLEVAGLWTTAGQVQRPVSSTPKVTIDNSTLSPNMENEEEFFSSLGSRLSKLTDVCDNSFKEHKLVSLTPESSGSEAGGDITRHVNGATEDGNSTRSSQSSLNVDIKGALNNSATVGSEFTPNDTIDDSTAHESSASAHGDSNLLADSTKLTMHNSGNESDITGHNLEQSFDTSQLSNEGDLEDNNTVGTETGENTNSKTAEFENCDPKGRCGEYSDTRDSGDTCDHVASEHISVTLKNSSAVGNSVEMKHDDGSWHDFDASNTPFSQTQEGFLPTEDRTSIGDG